MNPPRNRKGWAGNPPPTGARASALPDRGLRCGAMSEGRELAGVAMPRPRVEGDDSGSITCISEGVGRYRFDVVEA